MGDTLFEGVF